VPIFYFGIFLCFTQQIIKKKREEGGEKGGKEGENRREKIEGRVKGELPEVIPTANRKRERLLGFECILSWSSARNSRWMVTLACVLI
jgi:hypothetical protein